MAATGRLSSSDPNLQNIPIRTELGREIRKAFVPAEKGWKILSADYNQIELRIMAHLSGDETLTESFRQGEDVHRGPLRRCSESRRNRSRTSTAGRPRPSISESCTAWGRSGSRSGSAFPTRRRRTSSPRTSRGIPRSTNTSRRTIASAYKNGYVTTLLNRRRYLPEIRSDNRNIREFGERTAVNTPIQGTAADLIKLAMIRIADRLRKDSWKSKMILQIHDELVFETPDSEVEGLSAMVKKEMEEAISLSVPVKVDVGVGANWFEAH